MKLLLLCLFAAFSLQAEIKTITLEEKNTVIFRSKFTGGSVAKAQTDLLRISKNLNKDENIYLVLDSPGGSVIAGMALIETAKTLPQKVHTITILAASMGYQTVQNLGTRYITPSGILMSHRASLSGLAGQIDGEIESRLGFYKDMTNNLDIIAANRVGLTLKDYKKLIVNEYWAGATKAVKDNHADEVAQIVCGDSLSGTIHKRVATFMGPMTVEFAKCPTIRYPVGLTRGSLSAYNDFLVQYKAERKVNLEELTK